MRAPHLYQSLRGFCLGAFAFSGARSSAGAEIPFAFEEHDARGRPALYEYRPLVRAFVEARGARAARGCGDTRDRARRARAASRRPRSSRARTRALGRPRPRALPHGAAAARGRDVAEAAAASTGTTTRSTAPTPRSSSRSSASERAYAAIAPLVGLDARRAVELGGGLRVRHAAAGELAAHWPEAQRPDAAESFGRETDRLCVLELERELTPADGASRRTRRASSPTPSRALRLATSGPIAAGPVLFERLDWRPFGVRPVLPIAATQPPGEPTRLDVVPRRDSRATLLDGSALADDDRELGEALDRWELSLFQDGPFRSEQLARVARRAARRRRRPVGCVAAHGGAARRDGS